jgi:hypothetical protein
MERFLIIVARDHPDLLRHLTRVYGHAEDVEIVLDRRTRPGGAWLGVDRRDSLDSAELETHGFLVIEPC